MDSLDSHTDYGSTPLLDTEIESQPLAQLALWLAAAERAGVYEPNAMVVGTVDAQSRPSSRTVLLKGLHDDALEFVTNYRSTKGRQLDVNPAVSLLFPWYSLHRQVIVIGEASRAPAATSDAYFASRPRASQLASLASEQSQPIATRAELERKIGALEREFEATAIIPRPSWWGAIRVVPTSVEFWQGRTSRVHDRLRYDSTPDGAWSVVRLQP